MKKEDLRQERAVYLTYTVLCFSAQISLALMICYQQFKGFDAAFETASVSLMMARFICVSVLHYFMFSNSRQGLNIMKFSMNHLDDFDTPKTAFLVGTMQFLMVLTLETVNILVVCSS